MNRVWVNIRDVFAPFFNSAVYLTMLRSREIHIRPSRRGGVISVGFPKLFRLTYGDFNIEKYTADESGVCYYSRIFLNVFEILPFT